MACAHTYNTHTSTTHPPHIPHSRGRGNQKRKQPDADAHSSDGEGHSDFDPNQLREHEEFTKVKNIGFIELGRYEMETWYFSPFPPEYNGTKVCCMCCVGLVVTLWGYMHMDGYMHNVYTSIYICPMMILPTIISRPTQSPSSFSSLPETVCGRV